MDSPPPSTSVRCCIAGGGPAGMMLGLLLARLGVDVLVLEKHADFLRDFRGDTIHPSTMDVIAELGLLDEFLQRPHQKATDVTVTFGNEALTLGDFSHLPTRSKFIALMPQWDFLDFLADHAKTYPNFELRMETEAIDLLRDGEKVVGVRARTPQGEIDIRADLVVGADGRKSVLRDKSGLKVENIGAPMDVLWMRLSRLPTDPSSLQGRIVAGHMLVMIDRCDYWQCAFVIPKGSLEDIRRSGIEGFREKIRTLAPFLGNRVLELTDWYQVKLLTVAVDRLTRWFKPGLLFIGDAAHAMSPIGGIGINLAIQDAVATANILGKALRDGPVDISLLAQVEERRAPPTRLTQRFQVVLQNQLISRVLASKGAMRPPLLLRVMTRLPFFRRIPARIVGMGFRPEHVRTG